MAVAVVVVVERALANEHKNVIAIFNAIFHEGQSQS